MNDTDLSQSVKIDGDDFSLSDVANLDLSGIKAVRGFTTPVGAFLFEAGKFTLDTVEMTDDKTQEKYKTPIIRIPFQIQHVYGLIQKDGEDPISEEACIGKNHYESFFFKTADGIGRLVAFLQDTGFVAAPTADGKTPLQEVLTQFEGHKFTARIAHSKNKNDPDKFYVNFKQGSVKPATNEQVASAAPIPAESKAA